LEERGIGGRLVWRRWLLGIEHQGDPLGNLFPGLDELLWVRWLWSVQVSAVAAVSTLRGPGDLSKLGAVFSLSSPLPRILTAVGEERVSTLDVEASLVDSGFPSSWLVLHIETREGSNAVLEPELGVYESRSHGVFLAWGLEPAKLGAHLVRPRSSGVVNINLSAEHLGSWTTSVARWRVASSGLIGNDLFEDQFLGFSNQWLEAVAHLDAFAILDRTSRDVGVERHEVVSAHAFAIGALEHLVNPVLHAIQSQGSLLADVGT
jgi:hypothetical protein